MKPMAETITPVKKAYACECGKRWSIVVKRAGIYTMACACGRTVVIQNGVIYSTEKGATKR